MPLFIRWIVSAFWRKFGPICDDRALLSSAGVNYSQWNDAEYGLKTLVACAALRLKAAIKERGARANDSRVAQDLAKFI